MRKVLYLMHVPWRWVKQRPHFVAERLTDHFDVYVPLEKQYIYHKDRFVRNEPAQNLKLRELFKLPHVEHPLVIGINSALIKFQLKRIINDFDFVWLTHPNLFAKIRDMLPPRCRVIYDCMDDVLEFPYVKSHRDYAKRISLLERDLVARSDLIFASSDHLKQKLTDRYGEAKGIFVVNNALSLDGGGAESNEGSSIPQEMETYFKPPETKITYMGTISEWIDIELILESLERFPGIHYLFFGPCEIKLPTHKRLLYAGPVEHKHVFNIMKRSDALVMPFKINALVLSIDPVKLYEYVYSCRPSIAVDYGETGKFADFIHLYDNREKYLRLISDLAQGNLGLKRSCADHEKFAQENTWKQRVKFMAERMLQKC